MATTALKRRLHTPTSAALLPLLPNHRLPVLVPHGRPQLGEGQLGQLHQLQGQVQQSQAHWTSSARLKGMAALSRPMAWPWSSEQEEGGGQPMSEACWEEVTTVGAGTVS